jgi:hypothetical protein
MNIQIKFIKTQSQLTIQSNFNCNFSGRAGLMTPFIYYHFLTLRYSSRRNPHTRNMFHEMRLATEAIANNPKAPPIIGKVLHGAIRLVSRLAPPSVQQQQHAQ